MLALLRKNNRKYKIFRGNRNLENNAVNKLVNNNYMENFITKVVNMLHFGMVCRHVWAQNTALPCGSCSHTYRLHPHPTITNENLSSVEYFTNKRKLGRLWSVSLMQSCFSALTCRTFFPWATRNQINKPLTKLQRPFWGQHLIKDY